MPASLYQSNFNMERIANFELPDSNSAATVKLALELASVGSNFGFDSSDLHLGLGDHLSLSSGPTLAQLDEKARKSQNMTECVPVPTSEHVAEIVGRQGEFFLIFFVAPSIDSAGVVGCLLGSRAPAGGISRGKVVSHPPGGGEGRQLGGNNQQTNRSVARQQRTGECHPACGIDYFLAG